MPPKREGRRGKREESGETRLSLSLLFPPFFYSPSPKRLRKGGYNFVENAKISWRGGGDLMLGVGALCV